MFKIGDRIGLMSSNWGFATGVVVGYRIDEKGVLRYIVGWIGVEDYGGGDLRGFERG